MPNSLSARKDRETQNKTDVRAFWRVDGTEAAVVGGVHVAHLKARALAGKAAGAQGRERAQVLELGQAHFPAA